MEGDIEEKVKRDRKEENRKYYERHKEKLREKVLCVECGLEYQRSSRTLHERSKKHRMIVEMNKLKKEIEKLKEGKCVNTE